MVKQLFVILILVVSGQLSLGVCASAGAEPIKAATPTQQSDDSDQEQAEQSEQAALGIERDAPVETVDKGGISFLQLLTKGGWFMLPLLLLSVLVGTIAVERFLALRRDKIFPKSLVAQLSHIAEVEGGLDPRRAYQICQRYPSSASYIMRSMLVKVGRSQSEMESAVSESAQREATRLARMSSWLTLAAAIAPLIGLLGTVWGITQAFYDTTQLVVGQNRAEALAEGIYTALVTTMTGLLIAIPAAILSHYYENRIVQLINEVEELCFNLLPQFERYEGQLRFTTGVPADANAMVADDDEVDSDGKAKSPNGSLLPDPPSRPEMFG